jgi:hypothetical protein
MALPMGMTRMTPMPTGMLPAMSTPSFLVYSSKHSAITGYFATFALLATMYSMTPGTKSSRKYSLKPFTTSNFTEPSTAIRLSTFSTSPESFLQRAAISSIRLGLRISRWRAISAISSVVTLSRILYSGSFAVTFIKPPVTPLAILFARARTFGLSAMLIPSRQTCSVSTLLSTS